MLFHLGFGEVWYNQGVGDADSFISLFKQRINDIFSQNWRSSLEDPTRARTYKLLRTDFVTWEYLETVNCASHLTAFARLVTSSHRLRVETGRWDKPVATEYKDRKCQLCNSGDIEDEYHFVLKCPVYSSIRRRCIPRQYWYRPNMMKFQNLFSKKCVHVIKALAKYTYLAFYQAAILTITALGDGRAIYISVAWREVEYKEKSDLNQMVFIPSANII